MRSEGIETLKAVARRSAWIVVLLVLLGVVAMSLIRHQQGAAYQASANIVLSPIDLAAALSGFQGYVDPTVLNQTEQALANSEQLFNRTAAETGGALGSGKELKGAMSVSKNGGTVTFTASGVDPARTVRIANAVAAAYPRWRVDVSSAAITQAIRQVENQLKASPTRDPNLVDLLNKLKVAKTATGGNVLLVEPADNATKTRPRPVRDALLGAFIGLFFGLILVAAREAIDTRVRSEGEVEEILSVPLVGAVETLPRRAGLVAIGRHRERFGDMYALLAANLAQTAVDGETIVIAVTSATAEEGKTTTASNLAAALATRSANVVLVDLDSRKPSLAKLFHIPPDAPGVDHIVSRRTRPEEMLWTVSLNGQGPIVYPALGETQHLDGVTALTANGGAKRGSLRVLPMGASGMPGGLAGRTPALRALLKSLSKNADFIVLDTPPALAMPEMTEISELVDTVLIVVRHGRVSRRSLAALTRIRRNWRSADVAAVLVGTPRHDESYAYYSRT
jgi:Mrp family chromosome partitioning ATPase